MIVFVFLFIGANQKLSGSDISSSGFEITELSSSKPDSQKTKAIRESGIDLGVITGAHVVDLEGESFGPKAMPTVGVALFPWIQLFNSIYVGAEVSMQYTFRSDYSNYYYYNDFGTFSFIPTLQLLLQGNVVRFFFLLGGGLGHSFSDHFSLSYPVGCIGTGIRFNNGFISSILLTYNHSFTESFQYFESVKLFANIRLLDNTGE